MAQSPDSNINLFKLDSGGRGSRNSSSVVAPLSNKSRTSLTSWQSYSNESGVEVGSSTIIDDDIASFWRAQGSRKKVTNKNVGVRKFATKFLLRPLNKRPRQHTHQSIPIGRQLIDDMLQELDEISVHHDDVLDSDIQNKWLAPYDNELNSFVSFSLFMELRLKNLLRQEAETRDDTEAPSPLAIAVVADMMLLLGSRLGAYSKIYRSLLDEIFNGLFIGFKRNASKPKNVSHFLSFSPYCKEYEEASKSLAELQDDHFVVQAGSKMRDVVKTFQSARTALEGGGEVFMKQACFRLWAQHVRRAKKHYKRVKYYYLRSFWCMWFNFLEDAKRESAAIVKKRLSNNGQNTSHLSPKDNPQDMAALLNYKESVDVTKNLSLIENSNEQLTHSSSMQHSILVTPVTTILPGPTSHKNLEVHSNAEDSDPMPTIMRLPLPLSIQSSNQLIAEIVVDMISYGPGSVSFLQFSAQYLFQRFESSYATAQYLQGLILCCQREHVSVPRLALFADLCGLKCRRRQYAYDERRPSFLVAFLVNMFGDEAPVRLKAIYDGSGLVDRSLFVRAVNAAFTQVYASQPTVLVAMVSSVLMLPAVNKSKPKTASTKKDGTGDAAVQMISLDQGLVLMMTLCKLELSLQEKKSEADKKKCLKSSNQDTTVPRSSMYNGVIAVQRLARSFIKKKTNQKSLVTTLYNRTDPRRENVVNGTTVQSQLQWAKGIMVGDEPLFDFCVRYDYSALADMAPELPL